MAPIKHPSRIHLLAAKAAPIVVVLQRKRAKLFHVTMVHTEKHWVKEGSWFRGVLYAIDCDVSFDGKYMVYLARGTRRKGAIWSGVCRLPWLKTLVHVESPFTGGGYFDGPRTLKTRGWDRGELVSSGDIPFTLARGTAHHRGNELGVIYPRLARDGFTRLGDKWGSERKLPGKTYQVARIGDDGWGLRPARGYPMLQARYLGYMDHGHKLGFSLDEHPHIVDGASWATWDSGRNLWVARPGIVEQYTLDGLRAGTPSFSLDVDRFEPFANLDQEAREQD
jgi:hypothetical protein